MSRSRAVAFDNGLLTIELFREIPEAMKPRRIAIGDAPTVRKLEAKAERGEDHVADDDNVLDFDVLLHLGTVFEIPKDVVDHPALTLGEKRAILASWMSDPPAIKSCPSMRAPAGLRKPVSIDEILDALRALDGGPRTPRVENLTASAPPNVRPQREIRSLRCQWMKNWRDFAHIAITGTAAR